ncbi:MAG: IclR family transcriptional regulator [Carbonactinosporaceae bacterium]
MPGNPAIDSVDKALQVLLLLRSRGRLRVTEVSDDLGVARSTAHRLLSTLAQRGFVSRDPFTRTYRSGPVLTDIGLASAAAIDIRPQARPHLEALSAELHETVNLVVLEGGSCRFLDGVAGDRPLLTRVRTGTILPAHATSGGKALLAELATDQIRTLCRPGLPRLTEHTITDGELLLDELRGVRTRGYALNCGESETGIGAVAVPVRDAHGRAVAAVAVSMPAARMRAATLPDLVRALQRAALGIGRELA